MKKTLLALTLMGAIFIVPTMSVSANSEVTSENVENSASIQEEVVAPEICPNNGVCDGTGKGQGQRKGQGQGQKNGLCDGTRMGRGKGNCNR